MFILALLTISLQAEGAHKLKKVKPYYSGSHMLLEIVASFNMGSVSDCPDMVWIDTSRIGDSLFLKVYYDISGVWAANFCQSIDTVDVGVLPVNLKMIKVEMYTIMIENDTDTTYRPQPWLIWLPLNVKEATVAEKLAIIPNPNNGHFVLQSELAGVSRLDIVDVTGRVLYSDNVRALTGVFKKEIDIGDAPPGLYLLRLYTDKGVLMRKLVVQ